MDKYRNEIKPKLECLSHVNKLLFAALTCEMLYPNYVSFSNKVKWGDSAILEDCIVTIYQTILDGGKYQQKTIEEAIDNLDTVTPDTEVFPSILTSFALDACTSIYSTLIYLIDRNIENVVDVAIYARDTVDMFIQEKEDLKYSDPMIEHKISSDSFMISEKDRQANLISKLIQLDKIDSSTIENLRSDQTIINLNVLGL